MKILTKIIKTLSMAVCARKCRTYWQSLLFGMLACNVFGDETGTPRLALIATGDDRAEVVAALIEARLTQRDDLDLLDRRMVGNLLDEQEWMSQASLTTDDALRAGSFLGCDVFAELRLQTFSKSTREFSAVASLIAFDAITGSRLVDQTFSGVGSPDRLAEMATVALTDAVRAWREIGDGVGRTLSVGTVRNVNLPSRSVGLPTVLRRLLERNLLAAGGGVTLLERQRLDFVNREARLSEDRRHQLLSSMVLIDIDMMQSAMPDDVRIRTVLTDLQGNHLAAIDQTGPASPITDLAERLTADILATLDITKPVMLAPKPYRRRLESVRFTAESEWLSDRSRWKTAAQAAEVAIALWPENREAQSLLAKALWNYPASRHSTESLLAEIDRHERILDIYEEWKRAGLILWFNVSWGINKYTTPTTALEEHIESLETVPIELTRRFDDYRRRARAAFMEPIPKSFSARRNVINAIPIWAKNSDAWLNDLLLVCGDDWILRDRSYEHVVAAKRKRGSSGLPVGRDPLDVENLSTAGKRRLFDFYIAHADDGNMDACLAAIDFAHRFSNDVPEAENIERRYLDRAIDLAVADGASSILRLVYFIEESFLLQTTLVDVYITALHRINQETDRRGTVIPDAYVLLDRWDQDAEPPGTYLIRAYRTVRDTTYIVRSHSSISRNIYLSRADSLRELQRVYRRRYHGPIPEDDLCPLEGKDDPTVWVNTDMLFKGHEFEWGQSIQAMEVHDDAIWVLSGFGNSYELMRMHPVTGKIVSIGQVQSGHTKSGQLSFSETTVYLPAGNTVLCFAKDGERTWTLELGDGLQDMIVNAAIEVDGNLYIGASRAKRSGNFAWTIRDGRLVRSPRAFVRHTPDMSPIAAHIAKHSHIGEGMLLVYSVEQQTWQMIAASARNETVSALDNTLPYRVSDFYHDRSGNRLLFGLHSTRHGQATELSGVWKMHVDSRSMQRISPRIRWAHAPRQSADGKWLVSANVDQLFFWSPETDAFDRESVAAIYNGVAESRDISLPVPSWGAHADITATLHDRIYMGWTCLVRHGDATRGTVLSTIPEGVMRTGDVHNSHRMPVSVRTYDGSVLIATRDAVWRMTPPPPPPNHDALPVTLCHSRAIAGNEITISTVLPKSDEFQWSLRHLSWRSERIPVAVAGAKEIRVAIPRDYIGLDNASDTLVVQAYLNDQLVAQGSVPIIIHSPYPVKSLQRAFSEAIHGIVETPRSGGLTTLLTEAQPDLFAGQSVANLAASAWDVAIVDGDWLVQHGDSGRDALLAFLAKQNRRVLLTGVMNSNPFLPSWAISHPLNNLSSLKETNYIVAVDRDHGMLREHEAANWLTVNDWNQAPAIVPLAGGDDRPMNLRPIYADAVSGVPFIVELFPSDGGRLLIIPFDLATALDTEIHAGYLLYRALQYLGQTDEPQWREVAYRENPATQRWLRNVGVISPRSLAVDGMPGSTDDVMFLAAQEWDDAVERWVRAGGTVIMLTNARGSVAPIENDDLYRAWIRGVSPVIIESYASMIAGKTESWQSLLPSKDARRPLLPGILDEVRIGAGRLLILAVPDTINPPARNLLSILLTNCEVRIGS